MMLMGQVGGRIEVVPAEGLKSTEDYISYGILERVRHHRRKPQLIRWEDLGQRQHTGSACNNEPELSSLHLV